MNGITLSLASVLFALIVVLAVVKVASALTVGVMP